jgi:hypothetical protein
MNWLYRIKRQLKLLRWEYRRRKTASRFGSDWLRAMPVVLGNAIPKSGSHLLIQVLLGLTKLGPFVDPGFPPINRDEANHKLDQAGMVANINQMRPGDVGYSYLGCEPPFIDLLTTPGVATVFMYRDPRDVVVSEIKYAADIQRNHDLHHYFSQELTTDEARLNFVIAGSPLPDLPYSGVRKRFHKYIGWLEQPVLSLRFEDVVLKRMVPFEALLDHLEGYGFTPAVPRPKAVETLMASIEPGKSGTFRKGQPGNWKKVFTQANKNLFKQEAGDILIQLGYEQDMDW